MHSLLSLELVVVLGAAILLCGALAPKLRMPPPVLLLAVGVLLGFVPGLRQAHLPPEAMLLIFLPALLFWESLTTSLREIRSNLRPIVLLSTVLVVVTAAAVAAVAHALRMAWGPAWILGAALAPTDATAVGVLALALPHRMITMLRGESLANDGTALVVYGLAISSTVGLEPFSVPPVAGLFLLSYAGGIAAGALTAWLSVQVRRRLDDPLLESLAVLTTPFTAFLLAEVLHASGVLAVVVAGLAISQIGPREARAQTRQQTVAFWTLASLVLNGALFVLIGLEVQSAVRSLTSVEFVRGLAAVAAVSAVVIGTRLVWLFTSPYREQQAWASVTTITPAVMKMMRSLPGSGSPEDSRSGTASARARETAPRNPATAMTTRGRAPTRRARCCGRRSRRRTRSSSDGPACRTTAPSRRSATSPRHWPTRPRFRSSPTWPPTCASTRHWPGGWARSTSVTSQSYEPSARTRWTHQQCSGSRSTSPCDWP